VFKIISVLGMPVEEGRGNAHYRQQYIDTSETRDTQRPWSFCKTCVAMKFVVDDDDDDDDP